MYNAAGMFIYCIETVSVYILCIKAVSVYILCLSIMPCYTDYQFSVTVYTAIINNKPMAVAGQVAQPTQSVGGDQQPPLPTPPVATTAP